MTFNISAKKKHRSHIGDIMGRTFIKFICTLLGEVIIYEFLKRFVSNTRYS